MQKSNADNRENELKVAELRQGDRLHSYGLTMGLSSFLISAEIIFCGYLLLNVEKLGKIGHSSTLFLLSGLAAVTGLIWRFCYNQTYHENVHNERSGHHELILKIQKIVYWLYVAFTIMFFSGIVGVGFNHIHNIEHGKLVPVSQNERLARQLSSDIGKLQKGLESIKESVDGLAKVKPELIMQNDSSLGDIELKGVIKDAPKSEETPKKESETDKEQPPIGTKS